VLDVACGTGRLLNYIDPPTYVGIDASKGMLKEARRKHGGGGRTFVNIEAERLSEVVALGIFDIACTFWSFSYFRDPQAVLACMHAALRRGGRVCVHAYAPRYSSRPSYILGDAQFNTFHPTEIELMLLGAGFRNVSKMPFRALGDRLVWRLPQSALTRLMRWEMEHLPAELGMTYVLTGTK
jgi:ubiquinone/menaquinone biosynthesis C-methylase UbiE